MPRIGKKWLYLLLFFGCIVRETREVSEDDPLLLDRFLHVIWDPSGLVRLWTAADQFFNIVSSWKGVARSLVTLPFKQARDERSHIMIKGYNRPGSRLGGDSIASHRERFAKVYSDPPEFTFTDQNFLQGGKGHTYVAASSSANFPLVAFPNEYPSGVMNQDYVGMPSVFEASFPLLAKYLLTSPANSLRLRDPSVSQMPPLTDLVKDSENTVSFGDPYQQLTWSNKYIGENTVSDGHPGSTKNVPYAIPKVLGHFFTSLLKGNAMRNTLAPQYGASFPFPVNTVFPAFHQMDSSKKGNDVSSLNSVHRNSKIRKTEGSLESSVNHVHHSDYHEEIKSPLGVVESLLVSTDPQVRLQMALRLLKDLGRSHLSRIETLEHSKE